MVAKIFWFFISIIIYVYLGYPLLLALLATIRPKPRWRSSAEPTVTLLIAAHNEESIIAQKLENSLSLDYPRERLQILVAGDGSDDRTAEITQEYAGRGVELSYVRLRKGKMAAINRAMPRVRGEIVVFSDANNMYAPDALRRLVAPFADPKVGAVSGAKTIIHGDGPLGESEGLYWRYESFIKMQETRLGSCTGVTGEIMAIRRDLFEAPPDNIINDDFCMAMQLIKRGYRVVYMPEARSYERVSISAKEEMARRSRIVAGRYQALTMADKLLPWRRPLVIWQMISHKFLRPLVPVALAGAFLTNLAAVVWPAHIQTKAAGQRIYQLGFPFNWIIMICQVLFYGLAWLGNRLESSGKLGRIIYLPTFLVNSNLAALVGLYRFLSGHQTTLWSRAQRRENLNPEYWELILDTNRNKERSYRLYEKDFS